MRQRVVIAMALALEPELIVMDEPTTALDVVVQREILQELETLKKRLGFAVLFITHDLSLLVEFSDRIAIMYAGEIVESAPSDVLFRRALHPYTAGLMRSFPPLTGPIVPLAGHPRLAARTSRCPPSGCRFHPRCPQCTTSDAGAVHAPDRASGRCCARSSPATTSPATWSSEPVSALEVQGLGKAFPIGGALSLRRELLHAVDDVSFTLRPAW